MPRLLNSNVMKGLTFPGWALLLLVLAAALYLRLRGVSYGFPFVVHTDEPILVEHALRMLRSGGLSPQNYQYPSLNFYVYLLLFKWLGSAIDPVVRAWPVQGFLYYLLGRLASVAWSMLTIFLVWEHSVRRHGRATGLLAAALLGSSVPYLLHSTFATVDVPTTLWMFSVTWAVFRMLDSRYASRWLIAAGVFAGLAAASKYNAGIVLAVPAAAVLLSPHSIPLSRIRALGLLAGTALLTFVVCVPVLLVAPDAVLNGVQWQWRYYSSGHFAQLASSWYSWQHYAHWLAGDWYRGTLLLFAGLGLVFQWHSSWRNATLFVLAPLLLFILMGFFTVHFERNIIPVYPYLCVLAATGFTGLLRFGQERSTARSGVALRALGGIAVAAFIVLSFAHANTVNEERLLPDTRWYTAEWVMHYIPPPAVFVDEVDTPPMDGLHPGYRRIALNYEGMAAPGLGRLLDSADYYITSASLSGLYLGDPALSAIAARRYRRLLDSEFVIHTEVASKGVSVGPKLQIIDLQLLRTTASDDVKTLFGISSNHTGKSEDMESREPGWNRKP